MPIRSRRLESPHVGCYDLGDEPLKPLFWLSAVNTLCALPLETDFTGVQGLAAEDEAVALLVGEAALYQGEVEGLVAAVDFVADDGMTEVREVDTDLVFATGQQLHFEQGEITFGTGETFQHFEGCLGRCAIGADAVFDGYDAVLVFAQGGVDDAAIGTYMTAHDGLVNLPHLAALPLLAELFGGGVGLGDKHKAAGLAVEAVNEVRIDAFTQMDTHPADEARVDIAFRGVADEVGGFVEDEEFVVFVDDFEEAGWRGKAQDASACG